MSSDGEISVSVNAEGTEDAVGQLGSNAVAEQQAAGDQPAGEMQQVEAIPGDGGDGGGRGGGGKGLGRLGSLLKKIAGILAVLGPILKAVGVLSKVAEAFVAPLAIVLLRLLQPVLAILIQVLPVWFDIVEILSGVLEKVAPLFNTIGILISLFQRAKSVLDNIVSKIPTDLKQAITSIPGDIKNFVMDLPAKIGAKIKDALPNTETGQNVFEAGSGFVEGFGESFTDQTGTANDIVNDVSIALGGGLGALVDRVERDPNKDI